MESIKIEESHTPFCHLNSDTNSNKTSHVQSSTHVSETIRQNGNDFEFLFNTMKSKLALFYSNLNTLFMLTEQKHERMCRQVDNTFNG